MDYRENEGIGGWLAFLIAVLLVLAPAFGIVNNYIGLWLFEAAHPMVKGSSTWRAIEWTTWAGVLIQSSLLFTAGWMLRTRFRASTVKYAICLFWAGGPIAALATLAVLNSIVGAPIFDPDNSRGLWHLLRDVIWAAIWTAYLLRSRRVQNTYRSGTASERNEAFEP